MRLGHHRPGLRAVLGVLAAVVVLAGAALASPSVALLLAPALVLLATLAAGLFPGEETIARARARRMRARPVRAPGRIARPKLRDVVRPAGVTLAYALAVRPPPANA